MSTIVNFDTYQFESTAAQNGTLTWREEVLMEALGYQDKQSFRKAVRRAMAACLTLNIEPHSDFIAIGKSYKFTRFACYLIAMNCDAKKPRVAMAQAYFALLADAIQSRQEQSTLVDRVVIREEVADGMKSLVKTASLHGVENYPRFMNAGYKGMYNMSLNNLELRKGIKPGEHLIDRMDRAELAANLFRVTQTDSKIKKDNIRGQTNLENTAYAVGKAVRGTMMDIGGAAPEDLPIAEHIKEAKKKLKTAGKKMKGLSSPHAHSELLFIAVKPEDLEDPVYTVDPEEDDSGNDVAD